LGIREENANMEWTDKPPTKPGWYWIVGVRDHDGPFAVLVEPIGSGGRLEYWVPFMDWSEPVTHETEGLRWYGPVEPPPFS
jgi:hypothetical protein